MQKKIKDDTISRQAAIDGVVKSCFGVASIVIAEAKAIQYIKRLPSVQPEAIRCKDCKHYYFADNRIPQEQRYTCELDGDRWKPDDYCSYAERRNDG